MEESPETRGSLLLRLRDHQDELAWQEFHSIYNPIVYRQLRRRGLQHADADDLSQQVMAKVSKAISQFEVDRRPGTFRKWLRTIALRCFINLTTRELRNDLPLDLAGELTDPTEPTDQFDATIELEWRRSLFQQAATDVRKEFGESVWLAFWRTVVEREPIEIVAQELDKSVGAIYVARSRVMKRLKEQIAQFQLGDLYRGNES